MNQNQELFLKLIKTEKTCVMFAPSYIVSFKYPDIIQQLRAMGADLVTEITYGAHLTNVNYEKYIAEHPEQKYYISSPCPTIVAIIKSQYPELEKYMVPVYSPIMCQAKVMRKKYKEHKLIFVAPCTAKRELEAKRFPGMLDAVITYKELKEIIEEENIENYKEQKASFDLCIKNNTKIYPTSGGLTMSSNIMKMIPKEEIKISDGFVEIKKTLEEIKNETTEYRFFDLLNCEGGCINGPEVADDKMIDERNNKIIKYKEQNIKTEEEEYDLEGESFYSEE